MPRKGFGSADCENRDRQIVYSVTQPADPSTFRGTVVYICTFSVFLKTSFKIHKTINSEGIFAEKNNQFNHGILCGIVYRDNYFLRNTCQYIQLNTGIGFMYTRKIKIHFLLEKM